MVVFGEAYRRVDDGRAELARLFDGRDRVRQHIGLVHHWLHRLVQRAALGGEIILIFDEHDRSRFRIHRLTPNDFLRARGRAPSSVRAIYAPIARRRRATAQRAADADIPWTIDPEVQSKALRMDALLHTKPADPKISNETSSKKAEPIRKRLPARCSSHARAGAGFRQSAALPVAT